MEEIIMIKGDSSDIYEFSSKQVDKLDDSWEGSWVISQKLGGDPILQGNLTKNENIYNDDSLIGEDFRKSYKIFEENGQEKVKFNEDVIDGSKCIISGKIYHEETDNDGNTIEVPEVNKYITITIKGLFVPYTREKRVKTDSEGNFTCELNLGKTIKIPANSFFIFQIMPTESEKLDVGTYSLSVEVRQKDTDGKIIFRREVLQAKLKIMAQGVK